MSKIIVFIIAIATIIVIAYSCNTNQAYDESSYDYDDDYSSYNSSSYSSSKSSSYDYDDPKAGESFSDYVKRVDPGLYSDLEDIYNSLE